MPEEFDRRSVKSLLGKLGWVAKVGKPVGWKTWLVTAGVAPPTKTIQAGLHTLVVAEEVVSSVSEVVVAATESRLKGLRAEKATVAAVVANERPALVDNGAHHVDKLQQVKAQVREEVKQDLESACNRRLSVLETAVEELKTSSVFQNNQTVAVQRDLAVVQQQVAGLPDQISALCKQLQQDSDGKLKEIASEFKLSLRERDNTIGSQFEEIKAMFEGATAKTRKVAVVNLLLFGVTNPTALLGKAEATIDWGLDAVAFAETSHTGLASRVIRSSFRKLGWKVLLGHAVRDKFATKSGADSFRGLSKGVALASKWPCYDVVPGKVPSDVWQGGRVHQLHVITVYLMPNAPPGSYRYQVNCSVLKTSPSQLTHFFGSRYSLPLLPPQR